MPIFFQQPVNTVDSLVEKWPRLGRLVPSAEYIEAGLRVFRADGKFPKIEMTESEADEALAFYNRLITDGRHVKLALEHPEEAALKLGVPVSEGALRAVRAGLSSPGAKVSDNGGTLATIAVVVVILVVVSGKDADQEIVVDSSGVIKI